jgi:putative transposase
MKRLLKLGRRWPRLLATWGEARRYLYCAGLHQRVYAKRIAGSMADRRRTYDDELYVHFVTFSVYRRRRLLDHDHPKRIVLGVLNEQLEILPAKCLGFVLMPDHVHALVWFPQPGQLRKFVHEWKRLSSYYVRQWYRTTAPNYVREFGEGVRFWQPKYYAFEIERREKLEEKLNYIHLNPVRTGLVARAVDWPWSSARWYEQRRSVGVKLEWIE